MHKILFVVPEDYGFISHRSLIAEKLILLGWKVLVATRVSHHSEAIRKADVELIEIGGDKDKRHSNSFAVIVKLFNIYRREKPDVIHHFTIRMVILGSVAAFFARNHSTVNTITGLGSAFIHNGVKYKAIRSVISFTLRMVLRSSVVTVQNQDDYDFIRGIGVSKARAHLILGSGVDTSLYYPVEKTNRVPIIILPSRMLWVKGVGEFVEAAKLLKEKHVECRCALVGGNDNNNPSSISDKQLLEWSDSGVVEWWGHCNNMQDIFSKADIVCLPSYREGLPKSLLEASSSGLPIVTTNTPGCREVVQHGQNGFLVDCCSALGLVEPLEQLVNSKKLRLSMGEKGRYATLSNYSSDIIDSINLDIYNNILKRK